MNEDLLAHLTRHVHTLAGEIGERNVYRPAALAAAARYIESEFAGSGYTVNRQAYVVRSEDTVSRLGGDEFVIVLPEISRAQDVEATAEKIIKTLSESLVLDGHSLVVTASIGIAIAEPEAKLNAAEPLAQADAAMYSAKRAGRNRYCFSG